MRCSVGHIGKNVKEVSNFKLMDVALIMCKNYIFLFQCSLTQDLTFFLIIIGEPNVCASLELVRKECFYSSKLQPDPAV